MPQNHLPILGFAQTRGDGGGGERGTRVGVQRPGGDAVAEPPDVAQYLRAVTARGAAIPAGLVSGRGADRFRTVLHLLAHGLRRARDGQPIHRASAKDRGQMTGAVVFKGEQMWMRAQKGQPLRIGPDPASRQENRRPRPLLHQALGDARIEGARAGVEGQGDPLFLARGGDTAKQRFHPVRGARRRSAQGGEAQAGEAAPGQTRMRHGPFNHGSGEKGQGARISCVWLSHARGDRANRAWDASCPGFEPVRGRKKLSTADERGCSWALTGSGWLASAGAGVRLAKHPGISAFIRVHPRLKPCFPPHRRHPHARCCPEPGSTRLPMPRGHAPLVRAKIF